MQINFKNKGDKLYKTEQFRFCFQGHETAVIEILNVIDEEVNDSYSFHISIQDGSVPRQYREINSEDHLLFKNINPDMQYKTVSSSKEECLQIAVNWVSYIMEFHSDKEIYVV